MNFKVKLTLIVLFASFIQFLPDATTAEPIDLSGEWDAVFIRMGEAVGTTFDAQEDIVKISQKGNEFLGTCVIGTQRIGKNEEAVKGKISNGKLEEIFISNPIDQVTYELAWNKGRATINEDVDLIVLYSFINYYHISVILKRKE